MSIRVAAENFAHAHGKNALIRRHGWEKPPHGIIKLNVDAALDQDTLDGAIGAVLRDHKGEFVAAANQKITGCLSVPVAEAMALRLGLELAHTAGCNRLLVNSDSMDVVDAMNQGGKSAALGAAVLDDCFYLAADCSKITFVHCPREANGVAHELAQLAKFSPPLVWLDNPPDSITPLLLKDVTIIEN